MNRVCVVRIVALLAALMICCGSVPFCCLAAETKSAAVENYLIGPGDVLDIAVWKNPDLTKTVIVLPDGKIAFPLVGSLTAADKDVGQLSAELRTRLSRYMPDVDLSVIVAKVNSMIVYVIGRVNNPGRFEINANITAMQALAMAGGLNPFAKKGEIKIFRRSLSEPGYLMFDYEEVSAGKKSSQDIWLKRGDLIVVP